MSKNEETSRGPAKPAVGVAHTTKTIRGTLVLEYEGGVPYGGRRKETVVLDVASLAHDGPGGVGMLMNWRLEGRGYLQESRYDFPDGHSVTDSVPVGVAPLPAVDEVAPAPEDSGDPLKEIDKHLHEARQEMARAYSEWMAAMKGGLHDTPTSQRAYQAYAAIRNVVASGVSARTMILGGG